jgi:hypothetical protein
MKLKIPPKEEEERDTVQLSFVTTKEVEKKIRDEAHKRRMSISGLINRIMTKIMMED